MEDFCQSQLLLQHETYRLQLHVFSEGCFSSTMLNVHLQSSLLFSLQASSCFFPKREEIEKQKSKERYNKLHSEGKTEQARADLARLAIIKKQREDAAKKREELRKGE